MGDAPTEALIPGGVKTTKILPVDNTTTPYWRTQLHPLDEHRSTEELPSECDIAIIGAGMSGVSTAYHLAIAMGSEKLRSIILLEARQLCSGATGRNGVRQAIRSLGKRIILILHYLGSCQDQDGHVLQIDTASWSRCGDGDQRFSDESNLCN